MGLVLWYMSDTPAPTIKRPVSNEPVNTAPEPTSQSLNESAPYFEITVSYPATTPLKASAGARADAQAVEVMKQFELNTISAFKEQGNFANLTQTDVQTLGLDQRKESLDITYQLKTGSKTVSYLYTMYQDTLGAHPNSYFRSFTFNKSGGEGIDIGDVFKPGTDYLTLLSTISRKKLPGVIGSKEGMKGSEVDVGYMNRGTTPDADNFQNWYIDGTSLVLIFPPYQVAPYSAGMQTLSIPFTELGTHLNSKYK